MNPVIEINSLTKDYGDHRGIFGIDLTIEKGEMLGFAGTNGSGKTTTIRHIMGFLKPDAGSVRVNGLDAWEHSSKFIRDIGYVPGEIAFPDLKTGVDFLKSQAAFLALKDTSRAEDLIRRLQLDPRASLKRMSKGMKQKTAIVAALMADPSIIVLDEPTTGLDPLMRDAFLDIIREEHARGKTIFMSSHMFNELETTCDRVALISNGCIESIVDMDTIRNPKLREYKIEFSTAADYEKSKQFGFEVVRDQPQYNQVTLRLSGDRLNELFFRLEMTDVRYIAEVSCNLEKYFRENLVKGNSKNVQ